ncbi:hypothetical protein AMJ57_02910 [Parcubacteria bacterium SG8_24]|nr:MAG: hypothetical protein AMJ57_02910 [Parcubacteria bacterium SG8_24]
MGLRVSLMPAEGRKERPPDTGRRALILVLVLIVETIVIGSLYFLTIQRTSVMESEKAKYEEEMTQLNQQIGTAVEEARDMRIFGVQMGAVQQALDSHVYWTKAFDFLAANTHPSVRYVNFTGDSRTRVIVVDAVGGSYKDVAEQIVIMRESPSVESVQTSSAAARVSEVGEIEGVSFSMVLRLSPEVWLDVSTGGGDI